MSAPAEDPLRTAAETMHAVRAQCAWSQQRTHRDLVAYLLEETHELIEAIEAGDRADLREELGDLLWQVLFHSAIAAEDADPFDIDDVARALTEKMTRRHPHVFAAARAATPEEVLVHWNAAKAAEKSARRSALDGIPAGMPALARAQKILGRADGGVGLSRPETEPTTPPQTEAQLGEVLLQLAAQARERGWDAERALRERVRRLEADVREAEGGGGPASASPGTGAST